MAKTGFYLDTRREKKDNTFPIKIYIKHNDKFLINTEFTGTSKTWNGYEFTNKCENYKAKNVAIRRLRNKIDSIILRLDEESKLIYLSDKKLKKIIEEEIHSTKKEDKKFIDYLEQFASIKDTDGTKGIYEQTKSKLLAFDPNATFETIDKSWLMQFEKWMIESGLKINSAGIHLRNIRSVFNYAIDEEYTTLYPFRKFKIKKEETAKRALTVFELIELMEAPCEDYQIKYRDLFFLIFYLIGINPVDLFNLKDIKKGRIEYYRAKTHKLYSVEVLPEAIEIINKYKGKEYLLYVCDEWKNYKDFTHRMNIGLKEIGELKRVGRGGKKIRKPLFPDITIYHARHTWASIAASLDIPKETISAALGHEIGSRVTSIYIDFDMKKVDEANRKIVDHLHEARKAKHTIEMLNAILSAFERIKL